MTSTPKKKKKRHRVANPMRLTPGYQSHPRRRAESEYDPGMQRAESAGQGPPNMGPAEGAQGNSTGGRGIRVERAAQRRQGTAPRGAQLLKKKKKKKKKKRGAQLCRGGHSFPALACGGGAVTNVLYALRCGLALFPEIRITAFLAPAQKKRFSLCCTSPDTWTICRPCVCVASSHHISCV